MAGSPLSRRTPGPARSWLTGPRVAALIGAWLVAAFLAAPFLGLYYEARASLYLAPPLFLVDAYCLTHPRRATALLAIIASAVAALAIGLVLLLPKATLTFGS